MPQKRAAPKATAGARKRNAENHGLMIKLRFQLEQCLAQMGAMRLSARLLAREPFGADMEIYLQIDELMERMHGEAIMATSDFARWRVTFPSI